MKPKLLALSLVFLTACYNTQDSVPGVVSQKYIHKYGFDVNEEEWDARSQEGQVVTLLKNGVKVTRSYENGLLHGPTTHTFPHSTVVEKQQMYDRGTLLKEVLCDASGMPVREDVYEFDDRRIITLWDEKGAPISIEEYDNELLVEGKYFTADNAIESHVEGGFGERIKRDRSNQLISKDLIEEGFAVKRTSYHPNGQIHTISNYHDYQLHGEQHKFTASGKPLMKLNWNHGVLDGTKVVFRNGTKIAAIPYNNGQKHGTEFHFDDLGNLTAEIEWRNDKKHGTSQFFSEENTETEWFYKGKGVTVQKFEMLENQDRLMADLNGDFE